MLLDWIGLELDPELDPIQSRFQKVRSIIPTTPTKTAFSFKGKISNASHAESFNLTLSCQYWPLPFFKYTKLNRHYLAPTTTTNSASSSRMFLSLVPKYSSQPPLYEILIYCQTIPHPIVVTMTHLALHTFNVTYWSKIYFHSDNTRYKQ